jgi:hypothetical protein
VHNDKTNSITRDNKTGVCVLIDIAVSGNRSVLKKEALSGYKSLAQSHLVGKKKSAVAPNTCQPALCNLLLVVFLALRILRWLPDCQKTCGPLL